MSIRYINGVPGAPKAVGPYSQATIIDNQIYMSGQIGLHPESGAIVPGGVEAEAERVMKNIIAVLGHLSVDFSHILKTTIFLADMNDFQKVNQVYSKWMMDCRPARSTVQVAALPLGAQIEIEVVAVLELDGGPMVQSGTVKDLQDLQEQYVSCKEQ